MIALIGSLDPLTEAIAMTLRAQGTPHMVCTLAERTVWEPPAGGPVSFRIEHLGSLLRRLSDRDVRAVCLCGRVRRPEFDPSQIDGATAPLVPRLAAALAQGDDGALRVVLGIFEEAGFAVRAAHEIAPDLLPPAGVLSSAQPTERQIADAARAESVHRLLAAADIGQGLVVHRSQVIAVEAQPGTDFMLRSVEGVAQGALFFKAPKQAQDRRADLPVIGPETVARARAAGLGAVVVEAGGVMMLRRADCVALADAAGIVLWVREPSA